MRTTLDIDSEVLEAAEEIAQTSHKSAEEVIAGLVLEASAKRKTSDGVVYRNGIPCFPKVEGGLRPTLEFVNRLRDETNDL